MSIFDDIPLPIGTAYFDRTIIGWDAEKQKYLIRDEVHPKDEPRWIPRGVVERHHAASLMEGVEVRKAKPGNSYNTRYFSKNSE